MAYDPKAEYVGHLARIGRNLLQFRGRSRRTEFAVYVVSVMVVSTAASILESLLTDAGPVSLVPYLVLALWLLAVPLFARRLHDQDRSGWFAVLIPVSVGLRLWGELMFDAGRMPVPSPASPISVLDAAAIIALWVFVLWPGTSGPSRFGPDPRNQEIPTAA